MKSIFNNFIDNIYSDPLKFSFFAITLLVFFASFLDVKGVVILGFVLTFFLLPSYFNYLDRRITKKHEKDKLPWKKKDG